MYCFTNHDIITFISATTSRIFEQLTFETYKLPKESPWQLHRPVAEFELSHHVPQDISVELAKLYTIAYISDIYELYTNVDTNRTKTDNGAGFAFYIPSFAITEALACSTDQTAYSIELLAIPHVLSWILEKFRKCVESWVRLTAK